MVSMHVECARQRGGGGGGGGGMQYCTFCI